MTATPRIKGVLSPVVTPFRSDLSPDPRRFIAHCKWLLSQNCGLAVFGTNSEANSLSVNERIALLDALIAADADPTRMMPGTGCCALTDTVRLTEHAVKAGCRRRAHASAVLLQGRERGRPLPQLRRSGGAGRRLRLRIYLYHIPPVSQVGITPEADRASDEGVPDSDCRHEGQLGRLEQHRGMFLEAFQPQGFDVFVGSESFLLENHARKRRGLHLRHGQCKPGPVDKLYREWRNPDAQSQQDGCRRYPARPRDSPYSMIPALKAVIAHYAEGSCLEHGAPAAGRTHAGAGRQSDRGSRRTRLRNARTAEEALPA